jgi:hypothetical protein
MSDKLLLDSDMTREIWASTCSQQNNRQYSQDQVTPPGPYEFQQPDHGYHSAESSRRPSAANVSMARDIPGLDPNYSWQGSSQDVDAGYYPPGKRSTSTSSRSSSFSSRSVTKKMEDEYDPRDLAGLPSRRSSHGAHGSRHGSTSTYSHSVQRERSSMSSKRSRHDSKVDPAEYDSLPQYQTFGGSKYTYDDVTMYA